MRGGVGKASSFPNSDTRSLAMRGDANVAMKKKDKPRSSPATTIESLMERADDFARRDPARATMSALGAGFLLNLLPLGAIASALTGIAFSFARPALLFLGLLKASEFCGCKNPTTPTDESK